MKTAILFKTHIWDEAVERNFLLCKRHGRDSDIFILLDPAGKAEIPAPYCDEERIFVIPYSDIEKLGLEWGMDSMRGGYWYNGDYHQHLFILKYPDYDYICTIENDVASHISIDGIFRRMNEDCVDVIYDPQTQPNNRWSHLEGCIGYCDTDNYIHKGLFCVSFFSRRAAIHILRRRLEMSVLRRKENLSSWPIGESVMVHETVIAGMTVADLSDYCDNLKMYDWAPCYLPIEDSAAKGKTFVHPVTILNNKFINSNFNQDYHALFSEMEVISGSSRERARRINDLEVYSRLFNSVHMQWEESRWGPLLEDAREHLPVNAKEILGGENLLKFADLVWSTEKAPHHLLSSALPLWMTGYVFEDDPANELLIQIPSEEGQRYTLVLGTEDSLLPKKLRMEGHDGPVATQRGIWRKMYFFQIAIPDGTEDIELFASEGPLEVCSLRLIKVPSENQT